MLHTYWVGDAMGIFKKHYRMNAKIALNIRIPPFWTDSDMIRDYHTYVFSAKSLLNYIPHRNGENKVLNDT